MVLPFRFCRFPALLTVPDTTGSPARFGFEHNELGWSFCIFFFSKSRRSQNSRTSRYNSTSMMSPARITNTSCITQPIFPFLGNASIIFPLPTIISVILYQLRMQNSEEQKRLVELSWQCRIWTSEIPDFSRLVKFTKSRKWFDSVSRYCWDWGWLTRKPRKRKSNPSMRRIALLL